MLSYYDIISGKMRAKNKQADSSSISNGSYGEMTFYRADLVSTKDKKRRSRLTKSKWEIPGFSLLMKKPSGVFAEGRQIKPNELTLFVLMQLFCANYFSVFLCLRRAVKKKVFGFHKIKKFRGQRKTKRKNSGARFFRLLSEFLLLFFLYK